MTHLKQSTAAYLSATLLVVAGCQLSAFEQGSYFIYQVVDQSDAQIVDKRLAVDSRLFIESDNAQVIITPKAEERSEFEMNYNSFGTTTNSNFEIAPPASNGAHTVKESSTFGIGTEDTPSLFGD